MPDVLPYQLVAPTFPEGYCPLSLQQFANDLQNGTTLVSPLSLDNIVISQTAPSDHTKLWFKLDGSLNPFTTIAGVPLYKWSPTLAAWVLRHPELPGSLKRIPYVGQNNTGGLWSLDGGDGSDPSVGGNVTDTTGSFWEVDTAFAARIPIGPGNLSGSGLAINVTDTGGADQLTQTAAQMAIHNHDIGLESSPDTGDSLPGRLRAAGTNVEWQTANETFIGHTRNAGGSGSPVVTQPMNIMNPFYGTFFIKRTARVYLVG